MTNMPYQLTSFLGAPLRWLFGIVHSSVHGDARWMSWLEKRRRFSYRNRGLFLSPRYRMSERDSFTHLVLVAPTGSGKTTRYVIPNLLTLQGSAVVTDPSGELFLKTSGHLKERGFHIQVLQPDDLSRSLNYNPLHRARNAQELRLLATTLGRNGAGKHSDPFWTTTAVNLIYLCLSALKEVEDPLFHNLANLRWLLNHMGGAGEAGIHDFMSRHLPTEQLFSEYLAFLAQDSRVIASILSSARACLELWSDPDIARLTAADSIALDRIRQERTVIYLIVPEHKIHYFSLLLNLFYSDCFANCLEKDPEGKGLPVFFFLDEFGNLGHINNFPAIITTLRKRRCSVSLILQELAQLTSIYGLDEARTIFSGGCGNKLFFSGLDIEASRYLEEVLGENTVYDTPFGGMDERARTVGVPLMRRDHVRMMHGKEAVLISGSRRPARITMPPFFKVPTLNRWAGKKPASFPLSLEIGEVPLLDLAGYRTVREEMVQSA